MKIKNLNKTTSANYASVEAFWACDSGCTCNCSWCDCYCVGATTEKSTYEASSSNDGRSDSYSSGIASQRVGK